MTARLRRRLGEAAWRICPELSRGNQFESDPRQRNPSTAFANEQRNFDLSERRLHLPTFPSVRIRS